MAVGPFPAAAGRWMLDQHTRTRAERGVWRRPGGTPRSPAPARDPRGGPRARWARGRHVSCGYTTEHLHGSPPPTGRHPQVGPPSRSDASGCTSRRCASSCAWQATCRSHCSSRGAGALGYPELALDHPDPRSRRRPRRRLPDGCGVRSSAGPVCACWPASDASREAVPAPPQRREPHPSPPGRLRAGDAARRGW